MSISKKTVSISAFLDENGKIKQLPVPNRTKMPVLAYLAQKFEEDRIYTEKEINTIIDEWHTFGDYFILRRLLIDHGFLARKTDGSAYWALPQETGREENANDKKRENEVPT